MTTKSIKTKTVPIEAIEDAFSVDTPTIVLKDDAPSQVLLNAFGEMMAIYRQALWDVMQSKDAKLAQIAKDAIRKASVAEKRAISESTNLINAEKARARKTASN